jgi:4-hydroxy-tetrahydrodipicolinate synthase
VVGRNRASRFAQMASLKVLVAARTGEEGWRRMRPPLLPLSAEEEAALLEV